MRISLVPFHTSGRCLFSLLAVILSSLSVPCISSSAVDSTDSFSGFLTLHIIEGIFTSSLIFAPWVNFHMFLINPPFIICCIYSCAFFLLLPKY